MTNSRKPVAKKSASSPSSKLTHPSSDGSSGSSGKPPSCWLNPNDEPSPNSAASFVEYLRWMRPADSSYKDPTKSQILQKAMENAQNYGPRLQRCIERTKRMASITFQVTCPWRIRVGGHRGPESILLPAFDALGMPYIPSATLRGVARNQAIREVMKTTGKDWKSAEKDSLVVRHFGSLEADKTQQSGKVVFFDAYPLKGNCLAVDMANNIWKWEGETLNYSPNPNSFLSLRKPTFVIGLGLISGCKDEALLNQVKEWLIAGLAIGAGSQINTGYGQLLENPKETINKPFLAVKFAIEGQLIHSYQKLGEWNWNNKREEWQIRGINQPEVRSTAFKSMLRYWFRVFALGEMLPKDVKTLEAKLFGSLDPQSLGLIKVNIVELKSEEEQEQTGILRLFYTSQVKENQKSNLRDLFNSLTWLMFYLGGIGQGARRPAYERQNNPFIRGSSFFVIQPDRFSIIPNNANQFAVLMSEKIKQFFDNLNLLKQEYNFQNRTNNIDPSNHQWLECADHSCRIFIIPNTYEQANKYYALSQLNNKFHRLDDEVQFLKNEKKFAESKQKYSELKSLCGGVNTDKILVNGIERERKVIPSPIWIRSLGPFDVVTVFGATASPRKNYLDSLQGKIQVFPL